MRAKSSHLPTGIPYQGTADPTHGTTHHVADTLFLRKQNPLPSSQSMAVCPYCCTDSASGLLAALVSEWIGPMSPSAADAGCEGGGEGRRREEQPNPVPTVKPDRHGCEACSSHTAGKAVTMGDVALCHTVLCPCCSLYQSSTTV